MTSAKPSFWSLTQPQLEATLTGWGEPRFRVAQVWRRAYHDLASSFDEMTELPAALRSRMAATYALRTFEVVATIESAETTTHKALWRLPDGMTVETVLMIYPKTARGRARSTICVSSQAGCAMGCVFCATGQQGFLRHMETAEIVEQIVAFSALARDRGSPVTNVVFMGMGEPLHNYDNVIAAVRRINDSDSLALGARRITISTVGLVPGILRLAGENLQVGLAVSLHAPDDALRAELVPAAKRYTIGDILDACREYQRQTGRRVTFEYCLIAGVNDEPEQGRALAGRIRDLGAHVNLIPVNPTGNGEIQRPSRNRVVAFQRAVQAAGVACTVRVEKGIEIAAGCGQLRGVEFGRAGRPDLAVAGSP